MRSYVWRIALQKFGAWFNLAESARWESCPLTLLYQRSRSTPNRHGTGTAHSGLCCPKRCQISGACPVCHSFLCWMVKSEISAVSAKAAAFLASLFRSRQLMEPLSLPSSQQIVPKRSQQVTCKNLIFLKFVNPPCRTSAPDVKWWFCLWLSRLCSYCSATKKTSSESEIRTAIRKRPLDSTNCLLIKQLKWTRHCWTQQ